MTEAEWLQGTNPAPMLEFLQGQVSDRKLRLFACACCRTIWHLLADQRSRQAVEIAEDFAEGLVTVEELQLACRQAENAFYDLEGAYSVVLDSYCDPLVDAHRAAANTASDAPYSRAGSVALCVARATMPFRSRENALNGNPDGLVSLVPILREITGNPFRQVTIKQTSLTWNDGTVVKLAQSIHQARTFDCMPILADALEDAGCHNPYILAHCRSDLNHVRGCWVVDLLLDKK